MKDKKFDILEKVKAIDAGNKISASLSIGIGINGDSIGQNDKFARTAIDMALGRGGDQAVIKDGNKYIFYGGKSNAYEKSTRVKARVVASALKQLILNSDSVFIMGHKNADVDSLGAALGLSRAVKNSGKPVYIILETYGYTVKNMLKRLEKSDEYNGLFITPVQASAKVTHKSLVIVVDTHKPSMVECRDALKNADQIVVIDHHRRSTEFIDNASLVYHEPYASSSSELVSEILQYIDEKSNLTKLEAEALYAGINVDTKNFTFKTGVRTFDAASFLKKVGVDTISVKKLFQNNMEMIINRAEIVRLAEIYRDKIAISEVSDPIDNIETIVAQAADDMLEIEGITASFVIAQTGTNDVIISARSLGDINVQVVMEKLDGGGHLTMAGAQIKNINISSAAIKLKNAIDEYLNEVA